MASRILMGVQYYDRLVPISKMSVSGLFCFPADQNDGEKLMVVTAVDKDKVYYRKARVPNDPGSDAPLDTDIVPVMAFNNYQIVD